MPSKIVIQRPPEGDRVSTAINGLDFLFNGDVKPKDRKIGFILLVFPMDETDDGYCHCAANIQNFSRMVEVMQKMIQRVGDSLPTEGNA